MFKKEKNQKGLFLWVALGISGAILPIIFMLFLQNDILCGIVVPNILAIPYSPFFVKI